MSASPVFLLSFYCVAIAVFSLMGGWITQRIRMTHNRTQLMMSFVSGLMLGVAFYHLLPHSMALFGGDHAADETVWWLMIGLVVMLLLLRLFHFHQHDFSHGEPQSHNHHDYSHHNHHSGSIHSLSWVGIGLGLGVHTLIDGIALGAVLQGESGADSMGGLLGVGVFLAILLHKPLDAMSIITVMEAGGWSLKARWLVNIGFALMCPLGALLFYFGVDMAGDDRNLGVAIALAFSAGAFICIALSDLLPEVQFHSHDRGKLTLAFIVGIALAYAMGSLEPAGAHLAHH
ncbi:MAG: ZIP family metal transporter [Parahaliea sp.]